MASTGIASRQRLSSALQSFLGIFSLESSVSGPNKQRAFLTPNHISASNRSTRTAVVLFYIAVAVVVLSQLLSGSKSEGGVSGRANRIKEESGADGTHSRLSAYPNMLVADTPPFQGVSSERDSSQDSSARTTIDGGSDTNSVIGADAGIEAAVDPPDVNVNRTAAPGTKDGDAVARLIVLTMDRSQSLRRLLKSAVDADYSGDHVDLDIWIDRSEGGLINAEVLAAAKQLQWPHGAKTIYERRKNGGLYQQWIYTWRITEHSDEVAIILEDDLELSPAFYLWLKLSRSAYAADPEVAAFTLQRSTLRPRIPPGGVGNLLSIPSDQPVFKYRLLGSWGFSPQRDAWVEFRKWYEMKRAAGEKPYVDNLITTKWYKDQEKNGVATTMWTQWWIKFADEKGYFTVTPHLTDGTTLCANWREKGMHYSKGKPTRDFPIYTGSSAQFSWPENPMKIDWDGREIQQ